MGIKIRIRGKGQYFYLDINNRGRRKIESLGFSLPADKNGQREAWKMAEAIRIKRELQLAAGRFQLMDPVGSRKTIIQYAEEIAQGYDKKMHLPKSLKYLKPYAGTTLLCDIDEMFCDGFRTYLLAQTTLGATTSSHYLEAFKALLSRAERERLIERNPSKGMKGIRSGEAKKPYLTIKEIQLLDDTPVAGGELADQCKRGFLLSCFTGLRLGDIKDLRWGDVSVEPLPSITRQQNKTGGIVSVPLCPTAVRLIGEQGKKALEELVFPRLTSSESVNVHQPLIALRKCAGIAKKFGWHAGRHSFAMLSLQASGDIYSVSRLLGHSNVAITTEYLRLTDPRKREIIDSLPSLDMEAIPKDSKEIETDKKKKNENR